LSDPLYPHPRNKVGSRTSWLPTDIGCHHENYSCHSIESWERLVYADPEKNLPKLISWDEPLATSGGYGLLMRIFHQTDREVLEKIAMNNFSRLSFSDGSPILIGFELSENPGIKPLNWKYADWDSIRSVSYTHLTLPTNREV